MERNAGSSSVGSAGGRIGRSTAGGPPSGVSTAVVIHPAATVVPSAAVTVVWLTTAERPRRSTSVSSWSAPVPDGPKSDDGARRRVRLVVTIQSGRAAMPLARPPIESTRAARTPVGVRPSSSVRWAGAAKGPRSTAKGSEPSVRSVTAIPR